MKHVKRIVMACFLVCAAFLLGVIAKPGTVWAAETTTANINFYVSINNSWKLVGDTAQAVTVAKVPFDSGRITYAISTDELESIYGEYGFTSDMVTKSLNPTMFRHALRNNATIWGDRLPLEYEGQVYVQILKPSDGRDCDVYYLPNSSTDTSSTLSANDSTITRKNSFYPITIESTSNSAISYASETFYALRSQTTTIELDTNSFDGYEWTLSDLASNVSVKDSSITITSPTKAMTIKLNIQGNSSSTDYTPEEVSDAQGNINFYALINEKWVNIAGGAKTVPLKKLTIPGRTKQTTYAISTETLEDVYGSGLFLASSVDVSKNQNITIFRHGKIGEAYMWNDRYPFTYKGNTYWQLLTGDISANCDVFYLPNSTSTADKLSRKDTSIMKQNTFYTVDIETPSELQITSSETQYVLTGQSLSLTLPLVKGYQWTSDEIDLDSVKISESSEQASYRISPTQATVIRLEKGAEVEEEEEEEESTEVGSYEAEMYFYVSVNDEWILVNDDATTVSLKTLTIPGRNGQTTHAISVEELEKVYGNYGFRASTVDVDSRTNISIFRHAVHGYTSAWNDRLPFEYEGTTYWQLLTGDKTETCDLYYLPASSSLSDSINVEDSALIKANTHYTIDFQDVNGETNTILPTYYIAKNSYLTVQLPISDGITWESDDVDLTSVVVSETKDSVTYRISPTKATVIRQVSTSASEDRDDTGDGDDTGDSSDDTTSGGDNTGDTTDDTTGNDDADSGDSVDQSIQNAVINFYASVNNEWELVGGSSTTAEVRKLRPDGEDTDIYAISADTLKEVYSSFGFKPSQISLEDSVNVTIFRHAWQGSSDAYLGGLPFTYDGSIYFRLFTTEQAADCDIYYLPGSASLEESLDINDSTLKTENSFYQITFSSETDLVELPEDRYVFNGSSATLTIPKVDGYTWTSEEIDLNTVIIRDRSTYVTYRITPEQPVHIRLVQDSLVEDENANVDNSDR